MRGYLYGCATGFALALAAAIYAGGDSVTQAGLRLAALEMGIAEAGRHWTWHAAPIAEQREEPAPEQQASVRAPGKRPVPRRK